MGGGAACRGLVLILSARAAQQVAGGSQMKPAFLVITAFTGFIYAVKWAHRHGAFRVAPPGAPACGQRALTPGLRRVRPDLALALSRALRHSSRANWPMR